MSTTLTDHPLEPENFPLRDKEPHPAMNAAPDWSKWLVRIERLLDPPLSAQFPHFAARFLCR